MRERWRKLQGWVHRHEKAFHHAHGATHMSYLMLVASHGPYHWAAAILFVLGLVGYILHLELE